MLRTYRLVFGAALMVSWSVLVAKQSFAAPSVAKIVRVQGDVVVLSSPVDVAPKEGGPWVLLDGKYYQSRPAKIGDQLPLNSYLQTRADSKALMVYRNGDQIAVGENTAYYMRWNPGKGNEKPLIDMLFGKVRMTIQKGGEQANSQVRTRSAVMGVRGTDFFVVAEALDSHLVVLRGEVSLEGVNQSPGAKPVAVSAGQVAKSSLSGDAAAPTAKVEPPRKAYQHELGALAAISDIKKPDVEKLDPATRDEVKKLEVAAFNGTLNDIKTNDPKLYQKLKNNKSLTDVSALAAASLKAKSSYAPTLEKKGKPTDLKGVDDVYERYFKR